MSSALLPLSAAGAGVSTGAVGVAGATSKGTVSALATGVAVAGVADAGVADAGVADSGVEDCEDISATWLYLPVICGYLSRIERII